jgi:hypothetical protein
MDRPYPQSNFTVVIWEEDRAKFGAPETGFANRRVCVSGRIEQYRGKAEMVVRDPGQIQAQ